MMRSRQAGVSAVGLLLILAMAGFFAYMVIKLVPAYSQFISVGKAMQQIAANGADGKSPDDIRRGLLKQLSFQYVDDATIKADDITVVHDDNGGSALNVTYDKQIPFVYNIDFLLHFDKTVPLHGNVAQ